MKKLLLSALAVIVLVCAAFSFACGGTTNNPSQNERQDDSSQTEKPELAEITGVAFADVSCDYDGTEKTITISGSLPQGVTVSYENNKATDAGEYSSTAKLSGEGYEPLELHAKLTINKIPFSGVSAETEQSAIYDGSLHLPELTGDLPRNTKVKFYIDDCETEGVSKKGSYIVKIVLSAKNYVDKIIEVSYKIKFDAIKYAASVISSFGKVPDPWVFLPESFAINNRVLSSENKPDYEKDTSVSSIPKNGTGKQLNVVYGVLNKTSAALTFVNKIYSALNGMQTAYASFLDDTDTDGKSFDYNAGAFSAVLSVKDNGYYISAAIGETGVTLFSDTKDNFYGAKVSLAANTVLKFIVKSDYLKIGLNVLDTASTQIEFISDDKSTTGYIYEYLTVAGKEVVATSAMLEWNKAGGYTTLIGTKGDFVPTAVSRNCEVYRNSDGKLVGSEVREEITTKSVVSVTATYNTLWYGLDRVSAIKQIRKVDKENGVNADTIFINGNAKAIKTKTVGSITDLTKNAKALSRRFDIEFKTMYFYEYNAETEEYEQTTCEIPMIFIQEEQLLTFEKDFAEANKHCLTENVSLIVLKQDGEAIKSGYYELLKKYDLIKEAVTQKAIIDFCAG